MIGRGKVIRRFPMVLGVDLAGEVLESNTPGFKAGDGIELIATAPRFEAQAFEEHCSD